MLSKKFIAALGITGLISLTVLSSSFAASNSQTATATPTAKATTTAVPSSPKAGLVSNRLGTVSAISSNGLTTFVTFGGTKNTFVVASNTKYFGINGVQKSGKDLKKNRTVNAIGTINSRGEMVASTVIFLPSTISSTAWNNPRDYGKVTKVNASANTFELEGRNGIVTHTVNSSTIFQSDVNSLSSLKKGMTVSLAYRKESKTLFVVTAMVAYKPAK